MAYPSPDFNRLLSVFRRDRLPDRVPFYEFFHDKEIVSAVLGEVVVKPELDSPRALLEPFFRQRAEFLRRLGYDYVNCMIGPNLHITHLEVADTAGLARDKRGWIDESHGLIETWADYEAYRWPAPGEFTTLPLEVCAELLPEGMKIVANPPGGVLENVMWLMGYIPMAYALVDQPGLVEAMFARCGELLLAAIEVEAQHPAVGAVMLADDLGFKTGPLVQPDLLREHCFPWYRKMAEAVHGQGKPFGLHCCGMLDTVVEDLLDVPFDAKHSFEDVIMPAGEFKRRYGERTGVLGGIDVHVLASGTEAEVRAYTRRVIEECKPGGGWALGSGNSLANFIPLANFLAMLDEGRRCGEY